MCCPWSGVILLILDNSCQEHSWRHSAKGTCQSNNSYSVDKIKKINTSATKNLQKKQNKNKSTSATTKIILLPSFFKLIACNSSFWYERILMKSSLGLQLFYFCFIRHFLNTVSRQPLVISIYQREKEKEWWKGKGRSGERVWIKRNILVK